MPQGVQSSDMPRFGRRLLLLELFSDVLELALCGAPLALWAGELWRESLALKMGAPLLLAGWIAAVLRMAYLLRPLLDVVAKARQGQKPNVPVAESAQAALTKIPRELAWVHVITWVVVAACPVGVALGSDGDSLRAVALFQLVLFTSLGLAAGRMMAIDTILGKARPVVLPNVQDIRLFAERYRASLLAVGIGIGGVWQIGTAFLARGLAGVSGHVLTSAVLWAGPILVLSAAVWSRLLSQQSRPIEAYFDAAFRAKGSSKGVSRDEPKAVNAFIAAQRTPYVLGAVLVGALLIAACTAVGYLLWGGLVSRPAAGRLLGVAVLVSVLAVFYQTLLLQHSFRPLIRHLGSRHALPLDRARSPLGLRAKLLISITVVVACACAFTALAGAPSTFWSLAPLGVSLAAVLGVVLLLVRDVVVPLQVLEQRSEEMAKGQLARPVPPWGEADEIGRLAVMFEEMRRSLRDRLRSTESINVDLEREVRRRTEALEQRNAELYDALDKLRRAQDNLIRSEKLASMGRLVAGIAHEINNPVNAVINSIGPLDELVKRMAEDEQCDPRQLAREAVEILTVVQRGAARTKSIVQALHGYARGDDSVQREVSLARSVDDTLGLLQHRLRNVNIVKDVDPRAKIQGFAGQIDQVLMNLLTNAAQALGDRAGTIRLEVAIKDDRVLMSVADDGPGIPKEVLPRIFDPFFTTKDVGEGSGLGLSIVHGIIERHGGHIDVQSEVGHGTKFSISLPFPAAGRVA